MLTYVVHTVQAFGGVIFFFTDSNDGANSKARAMMTGVLVVVFVCVVGTFVGGLVMKVVQASRRRRSKRLLRSKFGDGTPEDAVRSVELATTKSRNPLYAKSHARPVEAAAPVGGSSAVTVTTRSSAEPPLPDGPSARRKGRASFAAARSRRSSLLGRRQSVFG